MGFFETSQLQLKTQTSGKGQSCPSCGLYKFVFSPRMQPFGNFKKGILNIGEAPGAEEDRKGKQWQGQMGRLLQETYRKLGIDLFEDCLNINAINCRPTDKKGANRPPSLDEINCCRTKVIEVIKRYNPKVIVLFGGAAVRSLIGHRWKKDFEGISKWRGFIIPDRDFHAWICPVFHPSYVARQERDTRHIETVWKEDLKAALKMHVVAFPKFPDEKNQIEIIREDKVVVTRVLKELNAGSFPPDPNVVSFDIETTGLKPHNREAHQIACMAFCNNPNYAQVITAPSRKGHKELFQQLMLSSTIGKIGANIKFETMWIKTFYDIWIRNWKFDTMLASHILDNRQRVTGLKFQVYVNFGVVDYDSEIESYLKGKDPKNTNSVNRIMELMATKEGADKVMRYCGMDALFTYKLALRQMEQLYISCK